MIVFNDKDRSELNDWLNQKGQKPKKIDNLKKKSIDFSFLIIYTNRINQDVKHIFNKGALFLLKDSQSIGLLKSTLSIDDLFMKMNKKIRAEDGSYPFALCIDFFMILEIETHLFKNLKMYIFNEIKKNTSYIESTKIQARNYHCLEHNSKKLKAEEFVKEFVDYEKAKKLNYYYSLNYSKKKK